MFLAWGYLYAQIKNHPSFFLQITDLYVKLQKNKAILLVICLLMVVNWLLEAKKWQVLISPLAKINLLESLQSVWVGLSLATFLPLGNYLGRAKNLPQKNRFDSAGALLVGGGLQFWVTMLGGIFGISQFFELNTSVSFLLLASWIMIYVVGLFLYNNLVFSKDENLRNDEIKTIKESLRGNIIFWLQKNLHYASQYSKKEILKVTLFALLRYFVFIVQMILIFKASSFLLSPQKIIVGSSLLFVAKSVLPVGGFLVGLSVREATALYFFSSLGEEKIVTITFLLWVINIGFPTLVGSVLLLKIKNN